MLPKAPGADGRTGGDVTTAVDSLAGLKQSVAAYLKPADLSRLEEAYHFSDAAHQGQYRKSGEPYVTHPVAVAKICGGSFLRCGALIGYGARP